MDMIVAASVASATSVMPRTPGRAKAVGSARRPSPAWGWIVRSAAAIFLCSVSVSNAQWQPVNLPNGSYLRTFTSMGTVLIAASDRGVYSSDDAGITWKRREPWTTERQFLSLASKDSLLFGGDLLRGMFVSRDTGATWKRLSAGVAGPYDPGPIIHSICIIGERIYAASVTGVFESTDNGVSWTERKLGQSELGISALVRQGRHLFAGTYSTSIFRMAIGDSSWSPVASSPLGSVVTLVSDSAFLYAGTWGGGVYVSADSGGSWHVMNDGSPVDSVVCMGRVGDVIMVRPDAGIFRWLGKGIGWTSVSAIDAPPTVTSFFEFGGMAFAASIGCYVSKNKGLTWAYQNAGLSRESVYALALIDTSVFVGAHFPGIFIIGQAGAKVLWSDSNATTMNARAIVGTASCQFAGIPGAGVKRSLSSGQSWTTVSNGLPNNSVEALSFENGRLLAGALGNVSWSVDQGEHWQSIGAGLPSSCTIFALLSRDSLVFAGTNWGMYCWSSRDSTWRARGDGLPPAVVLSLMPSGQSLLAGTGGYGVYRSMDDGMTWGPANSPLTESASVRTFMMYRGWTLAGTSKGVFVSSDGGVVWDSVNGGLNGSGVLSLCLAGDFIYAGTGAGAYRMRKDLLKTTALPLEQSAAVAEYRLCQNYPSPFNPSTTIRYGLPSRAHVVLTVFNTLGQQISTLVQGEQDAGYHEVRFDGANLSSGVYFYRLQSGSYAEVKKLLLVR